MISRQAKALFYLAAGPLMRLNGTIYKTFRASCLRWRGQSARPARPRPASLPRRLDQCGCEHVHGTLRCVVGYFRKLPFRDESVDVIYSHHVIEHLPDLPTHFRELHRVLKPGGVFRVGGTQW